MEGMQVLTWVVAFTLMAVANVLLLILRSFFKTILPTKRNLLTYLDEVLVISMAFTCSFEVSTDKLHLGLEFAFKTFQSIGPLGQ